MTEQESQQAQAIAEIKKYANSDGRGESMIAIRYQVVRSVVSIVDSQAQNIAELQARAPKQHTEAQLRKGFESWVKKNWRADLHKKALKREGAGYHSSTVNDHWTGWINGARYTNLLMETHA